VDLDAEHRPLVRLFPFRLPEPRPLCRVLLSTNEFEENFMGRGILLWLLGVPIPVIILLWLFFGH
jgi:hypothetical protein